jgi:hypothetical protein
LKIDGFVERGTAILYQAQDPGRKYVELDVAYREWAAEVRQWLVSNMPYYLGHFGNDGDSEPLDRVITPDDVFTGEEDDAEFDTKFNTVFSKPRREAVRANLRRLAEIELRL